MDTRADSDLVQWLAAVTGSPAAQVEAELAAGEQRRAFVAAELLDAGYRGTELLDLVFRLTGLDEPQARELLASHAS